MFAAPRHFSGPVHLPTTHLAPLSWFDSFLGYAPIKALLPIPIIAAIAPLIWLFFRDTWRELDNEAELARNAGGLDYRRPAACLIIVAMVLTLQEYYGGRRLLRGPGSGPWFAELEAHGHPRLNLAKYDEYYGYCWWVLRASPGYVLIPFPLWKLLFPKDSLLDMGLRGKGFTKHIWIYGLCLAVVIPAMLLVSKQPDFGNYYPFYHLALAQLVRFLDLGGHLLAAVLRARTVLPRLDRGRAAKVVRRWRHLRHGRALLHDPLREAVSRGARRHRRGHRLGLARDAHEEHLLRLPRPHYRGFFPWIFLALWHRGALPKVFWN